MEPVLKTLVIIAFISFLCEYVDASIGSTTIAESAVCIVAFVGYLIMSGTVLWKLAAATAVGSVIAGPLAAVTVSKVDTGKWKMIIGTAAVILGLVTIIRIFV